MKQDREQFQAASRFHGRAARFWLPRGLAERYGGDPLIALAVHAPARYHRMLRTVCGVAGCKCSLAWRALGGDVK